MGCSQSTPVQTESSGLAKEEVAASKTKPPEASPSAKPIDDDVNEKPSSTTTVENSVDSTSGTTPPPAVVVAAPPLPIVGAPTTVNNIVDGVTAIPRPIPIQQPLRPRLESAASTDGGQESSANGSGDEGNDSHTSSTGSRVARNNPKTLAHSTSAIGLDEMIDERREAGDFSQKIVHIEVPFGKPIEEVYDGVHNGPVLGSGISGLVRLVTHKATGLKYAVKVLDLGLVESTEGLSQLREEITILSQLDHPNIVRLEEVYESHSEIYLVQELCLGGELFDRLDEQIDYHYTEAVCARLIKQMLAAVSYCHSKGIIHRDLKLENFLFSSTAADSELKMIDFGLSKHFNYGETQSEAVGTPYTVAPEVIRGCYDERCDIWAIGVIAFLLLSGDPPFGGCGGPETLMTVRANILKGTFAFEPDYIWESVSQLAKDFIIKIMVTDPQKRPTAREAQQHKWLMDWKTRSQLMNGDMELNPNVVKALVNFKEYSDLRKLLCEVLSFTLLPEQIKELRKEFEKMDTDGSGEISLAALKQVLMTNAGAGSLGALTEEEVEDIFNAMRVSKSETRIHWHEFIAAGLSQCQVDDRNLRLAFDRLDSDHKGYITLDDILELMGSDTIQNEEAMRRMWGDSMRAVQCQQHRITYGDFLLLMKGQTREAPSQCLDRELETGISTSARHLHVVPEIEAHADESSEISPPRKMIEAATQPTALTPTSPPRAILDVVGDNTPPHRSFSSPIISTSHSAPSTPADHKRIIDLSDATGDEVDPDPDIVMSGPGVPGTAASLTPPQTPERGARDFVTPLAGDRLLVGIPLMSWDHKIAMPLSFERKPLSDPFTAIAPAVTIPLAPDGMAVPGIPPRPGLYTRRRSRSVDENDPEPPESPKDLHVVADVFRDMMVPETGNFHSNELDAVVKDGSKSALQVNRQLYRAHRHMRLAVLEASKRFEEQQSAHARDLILAQREEEEEGKGEQNIGMIQAGLVMRHGHSKQVSSEAIRNLLQENKVQQQALVEKANRRGGRGRRSRKKTISDMAGMLYSSKGQEEMAAIAAEAAAAEAPLSAKPIRNVVDPFLVGGAAPPELPTTDVGSLRPATVPGEFRKTADPFGRQGKYGYADDTRHASMPGLPR